ncbi:MAG: polyprenyl synthetase family protein [Flavobacteriaceae bacterium]|jgi:geranylgeranyl diphosphate synthase type II|nr:polyprenyl synthetase family protein [Flavobacteriaceae bacterium]
MHTVSQYQSFVSQYLSDFPSIKEPQNLYNPIEYILSLGGKRLRPVLTLMATEIFDVQYTKGLPAAAAVEIFHNFSLIHDDIMDNSPLRRGNQTVHEKWDVNTGILSGDAMLILAYQYFEQYKPEIFQALAKLFSKTALEVCEGQQWDIDFENRDDVTIGEYLKMIEYKTAVLVGAALKMGAIVAETSEENKELIYDFGLNLGIAFQLQDDYLDAFGNPETFGKQVGGDIIENKKTYLYLSTLEIVKPEEKEQLLHLYSIKPSDNTAKINSVKEVFNTSGAAKATQEVIKCYTEKALKTLEEMDIKDEKREVLRVFANNLMTRNV